MAWPNIDVNTPAGSEKKKFGDDRIREAKRNIVDALQAISNYTSDGTVPALRTAVWDTAGRPTGENLVDRVTGLNTDHGCNEYYDLAATSWEYHSGQGYWNTAGRPSSPPTGVIGYNTDLVVIERWSGSAWDRITGGRRGDIKMWSGSVSDIETGWLLCDGSTVSHPEGGTVTSPDMRDRFIVGAGNSYAVGTTGGEATHTLTIAEMPSHNHTVVGSVWMYGGGNSLREDGSSYIHSPSTTYAGGGQAHENRPPYYALCFLYKL